MHDEAAVNDTRFQSLGLRHGLDDRERAAQGECPFFHHRAEHVVAFAVVGCGPDDDLGAVAEFAERPVQFGAEFIHREAGGHEVLCF